ncbi:MAG: hypothetical protein WA354_23225 [Terracidiphilus sp.]
MNKRGYMDDSLLDCLAWLFVKTDEEILAEAEVAALHSMLLVEDTRPERARNNG